MWQCKQPCGLFLPVGWMLALCSRDHTNFLALMAMGANKFVFAASPGAKLP